MMNILNTFMSFLMWAGPATASGLLMGSASPHGMAGFIYSSAVLGVAGGIAFPVCWSLIGDGPEAPSKIHAGAGIGLVLGTLSFPISTLISGHNLYFPRDPIQFFLLAYLCALGTSLGCLAILIRRSLMRAVPTATAERNGVPLLPSRRDVAKVMPELVNRLRDDRP